MLLGDGMDEAAREPAPLESYATPYGKSSEACVNRGLWPSNELLYDEKPIVVLPLPGRSPPMSDE